MKLEKLYEYLKEQHSEDLLDIQNNRLLDNYPIKRESPMGLAVEYENEDGRDHDIFLYNAEYAAISVKFPRCKFIEIEFECPEMESENEFIVEEINSLYDAISGNYDNPALGECILNMDVNRDLGKNKVLGHSLTIRVWNGIILCSDHEQGGGIVWGYAVVDPEGCLVWDGTIPE